MFIFFFQAEDGIRDGTVTGVQTCALPILRVSGILRPEGTAVRDDAQSAVSFFQRETSRGLQPSALRHSRAEGLRAVEIGRASCRERVCVLVVGVSVRTDGTG